MSYVDQSLPHHIEAEATEYTHTLRGAESKAVAKLPDLITETDECGLSVACLFYVQSFTLIGTNIQSEKRSNRDYETKTSITG